MGKRYDLMNEMSSCLTQFACQREEKEGGGLMVVEFESLWQTSEWGDQRKAKDGQII